MKHLLSTINAILCIILLHSCSNDPAAENGIKTNTVVNTDSVILSMTKQVLTTIKNKDYKTLANFIHPTLGVRFAPYAYIDTAKSIIFSREEFLLAFNTQNKFVWGNYDGSGDTILLTVEEYFSKFVYNADFLNAEKTSLNKPIGAGNSLNNLESVYKDCNYTESYFSGFDKKYEGMDWCCLRLVYKKHIDNFYLIAIVHDQWTI